MEKVNKEVLARVEELLESVKKGEVESVFIVTTEKNRIVSHSWVNVENSFLMLGAVEDAKIELRNLTIER